MNLLAGAMVKVLGEKVRPRLLVKDPTYRDQLYKVSWSIIQYYRDQL